MRIIDAFPFWNEFDMLELRMETLYGVVGMHVAVAAEVTHAGHPNPYLAQYRGTDWAEKLFLHVMRPRDEFRGDSIAATRRREMSQRNGITDALQMMSAIERFRLNPEDIILISDADEIPNPDVVRYIAATGLEDGQVVVFRQRLCYYDVNTTRGDIWQGTRAVRYADLLALSPHIVRYGIAMPDEHYPKYAVAPNGGWHLSYFGGAERVKQKMTNFLHQELVNAENTDQDTVEQRIASGADIWGRPNEQFTVEHTRNVPPPLFTNPQRWQHLWRPGYEPSELR